MVDVNSTINQVNDAFAKISPVINRITSALVILLLGFILARIFGKIIEKVLHLLNIDKNIEKRRGLKFSFEKVISAIITYLIYVASVVWSLKVLGVPNTALYIILAVIVIIIIVFLLISFKDFLANFLGSTALKKKHKIEEGARIKMKNVEGKIVETGVFETHLKTKNGEDFFIPNALFWKEKFRKIMKPKKLKKLKKR
jgi:small-conductance mechanosensitive channel